MRFAVFSWPVLCSHDKHIVMDSNNISCEVVVLLNFSAALAVLLIALSIIFISAVQMQIFPKHNKKFYSVVNYGKHGVKVEPAQVNYQIAVGRNEDC